MDFGFKRSKALVEQFRTQVIQRKLGGCVMCRLRHLQGYKCIHPLQRTQGSACLGLKGLDLRGFGVTQGFALLLGSLSVEGSGVLELSLVKGHVCEGDLM